MLEAIEYYGLGNWNEIAQHVNDNRSSKEVEQHFNSVYLDPKGEYSMLWALCDIGHFAKCPGSMHNVRASCKMPHIYQYVTSSIEIIES